MHPAELLAPAIRAAHAVGPDTWALTRLDSGDVRLAVGHRVLAIVRDQTLEWIEPAAPPLAASLHARRVRAAMEGIDESTVERLAANAHTLATTPLCARQGGSDRVRTSFSPAHDPATLADLQARVPDLPTPNYGVAPPAPLGFGPPDGIDFTNPPALAAAMAVLDATEPVVVDIAGTAVAIEVVSRGTPTRWNFPIEGLPGVDALPGPVRLRASWLGGSADLTLLPDSWKTKGRMRHKVGLKLLVDLPRGGARELAWVTFAAGFDDPSARRPIPGNAYLITTTHDPDRPRSKRLSHALHTLVKESGIPQYSEWKAHLLDLDAQGTVWPTPDDAAHSYLWLAMYKLPFLLRHEPPDLFGSPLIELDDLAASAPRGRTPSIASETPEQGRRGAVHPMPGGYSAYPESARALVRAVADHDDPMPVDAFREHLLEEYGAGERYGSVIISSLLWLGLLSHADGQLRSTELGDEQVIEEDDEQLFDLFVARYTGFVETLVLLQARGPAAAEALLEPMNELLDTDWQKLPQILRRLGWIAALGLARKTAAGHILTAAGESALERHAEEARQVREAVAPLQADTGTPIDHIAPPDDDDADDDVEERRSARLRLDAPLIAPFLDGLSLPAGFMERATTALTAGKHLLLTGPPGTGKTRVAQVLANAARAEGATDGLRAVTAHADWTTADTVGGYMPTEEGGVRFQPGAFLTALAERQWLLIDELNRADVDQAFGELMTVLAGGTVQTPYTVDGAPVIIGPRTDGPYEVTPTFRLIATMNTWDKTSLFRLSYALQRRFAVLYLGVPSPVAYSDLIHTWASSPDPTIPHAPPLDHATAETVVHLFSPAGLLSARELGPALAEDVVRYLRVRLARAAIPSSAEALGAVAEALELYLLPQLEGLEAAPGRAVAEYLDEALAGAPEASRRRLLHRLEDTLPHAFG